MNKKSAKGFTLIELLVVVSIVSLVSSVAMYSTASARAKAEDAKKRSEVHQVETAISVKKTSTGKVPKNYNCAGSYCAGGNGTAVALEGTQAFNASMQELVNEGYISAIPKSRDGSYSYYANANAESASFGATLLGSTAPASKTSCSIVPASSPYSACHSAWYPDPPLYTGPGTVQFGGFVGETETDAFCAVYGSPACYPGGNGQHANVCRQNMGGFFGCGGPEPITYETISCLVNSGSHTVCAGGGNDYCACID